MKGLITQAKPSTNKDNPLLRAIVEQAEASVPQEMKDEFLSVFVAGGKLMWSPEMRDDRQEFDQALQQHKNVPTVVAHTVIKICAVVQNESGRDKPIDAIGLAAPIFMSHILQYVEAKHKIPVTEQIIDETAQLVSVNLLKMYGVTEEHMKELINQRSQEQNAQAPQPAQSAGAV